MNRTDPASVAAGPGLSPHEQGAAEQWDARYAGDEFLFGTEPNAWLAARHSCLPAAAQVLCVADGEGRNSVFLAGLGHRVSAFDVSPAALRKAMSLAAQRGVSVDYQHCGIASHLWPEDQHDAVVAVFVQFAGAVQRRQMFGSICRTLRPGGLLLLQGYSTAQLQYGTGGPSDPEMLYTEELLRTELPRAGLIVEACESYEAELHEGSRHRGRSALIGVIARKA